MGLHSVPQKFFIPIFLSGCHRASRLGNPLFNSMPLVSHLVLSNSMPRGFGLWSLVSWSQAPLLRQGQQNAQCPKGKSVGVIRKTHQQ